VATVVPMRMLRIWLLSVLDSEHSDYCIMMLRFASDRDSLSFVSVEKHLRIRRIPSRGASSYSEGFSDNSL
jgi:hypothetical protein